MSAQTEQKSIKPGRRKLPLQRLRIGVAVMFSALTNGYWVGFLQGRIYQGPLKMGCVPGLSCYACPGALGSCPMGALQNALASKTGRPPYFVIGYLLAVGALAGRFVCGWLCPIGLLQDLLHKLGGKRRRRNRTGRFGRSGRPGGDALLRRPIPAERWLRGIKYVVLAVFAIWLPLMAADAAGLGSPWFCKYLCPSGTLLGGWPLAIANPGIRSAVGWLFGWKSLLAAALVIGSVLLYRPFCKYICPLGAVYGLFNRIALFRLHLNRERCIRCGACNRICPMGIDVVRQPNSVECIRCGRCVTVCPTAALSVIPLKRQKSDAETGPGSIVRPAAESAAGPAAGPEARPAAGKPGAAEPPVCPGSARCGGCRGCPGAG